MLSCACDFVVVARLLRKIGVCAHDNVVMAAMLCSVPLNNVCDPVGGLTLAKALPVYDTIVLLQTRRRI